MSFKKRFFFKLKTTSFIVSVLFDGLLNTCKGQTNSLSSTVYPSEVRLLFVWAMWIFAMSFVLFKKCYREAENDAQYINEAQQLLVQLQWMKSNNILEKFKKPLLLTNIILNSLFENWLLHPVQNVLRSSLGLIRHWIWKKKKFICNKKSSFQSSNFKSKNGEIARTALKKKKVWCSEKNAHFCSKVSHGA